MPFLFLLVLALICLQNEWPEPPFALGLPGIALLTWGGVAGLAAVSAIVSRRLARRLHHDPARRPLVMRHFSRFRRYFLYCLLTFYGLALYLFGWGWVASSVMPGREFVLLAPLFSVMILAWAQFYHVEKAAHDQIPGENASPFPGRLAYVGLQARQNFLLTLPPLALVLVEQTALAWFPSLSEEKGWMSVLAGSLVATVFLGFPLLLRVILGLQRLPDGPLRERLLATSKRLRFRCTNILLWNTRGTMANAMVAGTVPFLRYVVLTDKLIEELEPEEVEAVFGHEVGHVKHHHMWFYLCFLMMSLLILGAIGQGMQSLLKQWPLAASMKEALSPWLLTNDILTNPLLVLLLASYVFVVFGFLSRRCERQADVFGCRTVSAPVFIDALEKVAQINGMNREKPGWLSSWQHSTIARRVAFLQRLEADPALEPHFQRRVGFIKWGTVLALVFVLAGIWYFATDNVWAFLQ